MSKFSIKQLVEGYKNDLFPAEELKDQIRATQAKRQEICKACPRNSSPGEINTFSHCKECGCVLKKKTACLSCSCPLEKWLFETTPDEDRELQKTLNYKKNEEEL